jgi:hypothetical protein
MPIHCLVRLPLVARGREGVTSGQVRPSSLNCDHDGAELAFGHEINRWS